MQEYHRLLRKVLDHGSYREDRTGTGAYSVFGEQSRYDLSSTFPLVTTKKLHLRSIIHELLWFLSGETNVRYQREHGVTGDRERAINQWIDTQLANYVKKDLGSPADPLLQVEQELPDLHLPWQCLAHFGCRWLCLRQ